MLSEYFSTRFTLPQPELPNLRGSEPEIAAQAVREAWGIGKKSITNVVHLLEKHGVKVFWLSEETASIDAFSFWKDDVPYIFLNTRKSGERSRFDAAHELAHLVLHRHGDVKGQDAEREADAFASAFLMPLENVMAVKMTLPTFDKIVQLKSLWKVSAMALIVRMRNLNMLTEWQYNSLMRDATAKGYRTGEPGGIERERSLIIEKMMTALAGNGINLTQLSEELNVPLDELSSLLYGVAAISGGNSGTSSSLSKASLRLV